MSKILTLTLYDNVINYSKMINNGRTCESILLSSIEELGELSAEVSTKLYGSYKPEGKDGIVGETIDLISIMVDFAYVYGVSDEVRKELENSTLSKQVDISDTVMLCGIVNGDLIKYYQDSDSRHVVVVSLVNAIFGLASMVFSFDGAESAVLDIQHNKLEKWKKHYA